MEICRYEECCGCGACEEVCMQRCVQLKVNEEGFYYPVIDEERCVNCGRCKNICPINSNGSKSVSIKAYAMYNKDKEVRMKSSSGGAFYTIAKQIIDEKGVVFGVACSEDCRSVRYVEIEEIDKMDAIMGSKYVQCIPNRVYTKVRNFLKQGRRVLFSGTPCQVAACRNFLKNESTKNLFTIDLICHGVPSPGVWKKYIDETMPNAQQVWFRDKTEGWKKFSLKMKDSYGGEFRERENQNSYMKGFMNSLFLRLCCYNCKFKGAERDSDITLGDFWNIGKFIPDYKEDKGISLVFSHSNKGDKMLSVIKDNEKIFIREVNAQAVAVENIMLNESVKMTAKRNKFFYNWPNQTVDFAVTRCLHRNIFQKIVGKLKWIILRK